MQPFLPVSHSEFTAGRESPPSLHWCCILIGRGFVWVTAGPKIGALPVLVTLAFLNGVRGTFAYHKLPPRPEGLPTLAQGFGALERNPTESKVPGKAAGD